ncbi:MAG: SPOCS domain-containing protein [Lachnospiraceae bacterium]
MLNKNKMSITSMKGTKRIQTMIDSDLNVPDSKPDVDKLIANQGEVLIQNVEVMVDKLRVEGKVRIAVLYAGSGSQSPLASFTHSIAFDEMIHMDGILPMDMVKVNGNLEDLTFSVINSRKLGVKGIVTLKITASDMDYIEGAVGVDEPKMEQLFKTIHLSSLAVNKKDTARVKEEYALPNNKPNIMHVLWDSVALHNQEIRLLEDAVSIQSELSLFVMYEAEDAPVQCVTWESQIHTSIPCENCNESMIENVVCSIGSKQVDIKPDEDGEERMIELELVLDLDMKIYEDRHANYLCDAYMPGAAYNIVRKDFTYENLLLKNNGKTRVSKRIALSDGMPKIMQICHVEGSVKIDDTSMQEQGIQIEGVVDATVIYISNQDQSPINSMNIMMPFSFLLETGTIGPEVGYDLNASLEQISANMLDGEEMECKAVIGVGVIAFVKGETSVITDVVEQAFDVAEFEKLPGMIGYYVKDGDTIWDIAKRYHTTRKQILDNNELLDEQVQPGDRLVIVKECNM